MKNWIIILGLLLSTFCVAQNSDSATIKYADSKYYLLDNLDLNSIDKKDRDLIESYLKVYHDNSPDTIKSNAISGIVEDCWDIKVWPRYNQWLNQFSKTKLNKELDASLYKFYSRIFASTIANKGYIEYERGNHSQSLKFYLQSLKIFEQLNDKNELAPLLNNIANTHEKQGDLEVSINYFNRSQKIYEELNDYVGQGLVLNNIAALYKGNSQLEKSIELFEKSLVLHKKANDEKGVARCFNNLGVATEETGNLDRAAIYFKSALKIRERNNFKDEIAYSLNGLADIETKLGQLDSARIRLERSLKITKELNFRSLKSNTMYLLSNLAIKEENYKEALDYFKSYKAISDSIKNQRTQMATIKQQAKYEYEKQKASDDLKNEQLLAIEKEAKEKQRIVLYGVGIILVLVIVFSGLLFNRYRVSQKQK